MTKMTDALWVNAKALKKTIRSIRGVIVGALVFVGLEALLMGIRTLILGAFPNMMFYGFLDYLFELMAIALFFGILIPSLETGKWFAVSGSGLLAYLPWISPIYFIYIIVLNLISFLRISNETINFLLLFLITYLGWTAISGAVTGDYVRKNPMQRMGEFLKEEVWTWTLEAIIVTLVFLVYKAKISSLLTLNMLGKFNWQVTFATLFYSFLSALTIVFSVSWGYFLRKRLNESSYRSREFQSRLED